MSLGCCHARVRSFSTPSLLATHSDWVHPTVTDRLATIPNCASVKSLVSEPIQCNSPAGKERKRPPKSVDRKRHEKGNWWLATWSIYCKEAKTQITLTLSETATACHLASVLKRHPRQCSAFLPRWSRSKVLLAFSGTDLYLHMQSEPHLATGVVRATVLYAGLPHICVSWKNSLNTCTEHFSYTLILRTYGLSENAQKKPKYIYHALVLTMILHSKT